MEYTLDTNVIVDLFKNKLKLDNLYGNFSITPIVAAELFKGAFLSGNKKESIEFIYIFVMNAGLLSFNIDACKNYGEKFAELKKMGKPTQESDLMIASIAMAHNSTLVTKNKKHFENIKGLDVVYV